MTENEEAVLENETPEVQLQEPEVQLQQPEAEQREPELELQAPELPTKVDSNLPGPVVVAYTDGADVAQNLVEDPELIKKIQEVDGHFRWNVWMCFFSCGLMALFSNYFVACWLFSLFGIYNSYRCDGAKKRGDLVQATLLSSEARLTFYITVLIGAAISVGLTLRFLAGQDFSAHDIFNVDKMRNEE